MNPQSPPAPVGTPIQQVADRLGRATSVLVTVSNNPSVDQLAACIGFTLMLNKLGKHATAVFSGQVPSTIEFLKPEQTLKKDTDSLRDFIIALDKSKADKLRYKIEDKFVKIFITPYRSSLSESDLEFSQGEVNVDVIVALGVHRREELDQAITAHGRILHDATVISVNTGAGTDIGAINWRDDKASGLCEMLSDLSESLKGGLLDAQIATAFLTGVVAETDRFSNARTSAQTMSVAARLINAGANQQLVASKLEPPEAPAPPTLPSRPPMSSRDSRGPKSSDSGSDNTELPRPTDGSLQIPHDESSNTGESDSLEPPQQQLEQINIDDEGVLRREAEMARERQRHPIPPLPPNPQLHTMLSPPVAIAATDTLEAVEEKVNSPHIDAIRQTVNEAADDSTLVNPANYQDLDVNDTEASEDLPSGAPRPHPLDSSTPPEGPPPLLPGTSSVL